MMKYGLLWMPCWGHMCLRHGNSLSDNVASPRDGQGAVLRLVCSEKLPYGVASTRLPQKFPHLPGQEIPAQLAVSRFFGAAYLASSESGIEVCELRTSEASRAVAGRCRRSNEELQRAPHSFFLSGLSSF